MPRKQRLGRTGEKHLNKKVKFAEGSSSDMPVFTLDMDDAKSEDSIVEDVLAGLINQVELRSTWRHGYGGMRSCTCGSGWTSWRQ